MPHAPLPHASLPHASLPHASLPGSLRCPKMRIDSNPRERELRHVRPPHRDQPGRQAPRNHHRMTPRRRRLGQNPAARRRPFSRDVEQILDADRYSRQRPRRPPDPAQPIHRVRARARRLRVNAHEHTASLAIGRGDPLEARIDQLPRRRLSGIERRLGLSDGLHGRDPAAPSRVGQPCFSLSLRARTGVRVRSAWAALTQLCSGGRGQKPGEGYK